MSRHSFDRNYDEHLTFRERIVFTTLLPGTLPILLLSFSLLMWLSPKSDHPDSGFNFVGPLILIFSGVFGIAGSISGILLGYVSAYIEWKRWYTALIGGTVFTLVGIFAGGPMLTGLALTIFGTFVD